jgi:carboxyl-terminal processing protease
MSSKFKVFVPVIFSIAVVFGMLLGYNLRDNMPRRKFFSTDKANPINEVLALINDKYVDSVDVQKLYDTAVKAILGKLDPHSVYIPATKLQDITEEMNGGFFGIGIHYVFINDSLHVTQVLPNGPSAKAGIQVGDVFIQAADSTITNMRGDLQRVKKVFRGDYGSNLTVKLLRNQKIQTVNVKRDLIPIKSIEVAYMLDAKTGYIKIETFSTKTHKEFMEALTALKKQGLTQLIIDLRDNGGGVLDEAVEIADEFLGGDKLITYTEGLHAPKKEYRCRRNGEFETGKLIVLANNQSASASEVLLGALQDWDRATIIGSTTFGKGLVQDQYDLSNGSAIRLTIAKYYTPLGRSIQRDYSKGKAYYYNQRANNFTDSTNTGTPFFTKAKKPLYEKNGITPDYIVPNDSLGYTKNIIALIEKEKLAQFAYLYSVKNSQIIRSYTTPEALINNFTVTNTEWGAFTSFLSKDTGFSNLNKNIATQKDSVSYWLKLAMLQQNFGIAGYYTFLNKTDKHILKALQVLNK